MEFRRTIFAFAIAVLMALTTVKTTMAGTSVHGRSDDHSAPEQSRRIRIGWDVMQAKWTEGKLPEYPQEAKEKKISGPVRLDIFVTAEGAVGEVKALEGVTELADPAANEAKQWKFQTTLLNGSPIAVETEIDLRFELHGDKGEVTCTNAHARRVKH